jgi:D-inositol-3-phosphate glycosyltransferase
LQGSTAILVVIMAKLKNKPLISVNHTLNPKIERKRKWWIRLLKRFVLSSCSQHICQMPSAVDNLHEVYKIPLAKITFAPFEGGADIYAPMALNKKSRRSKARKKMGIKSDEVILLFVGNMIPLKGPDLLIDVVAQLSNSKIKAYFVGPEEAGYGARGTLKFYKQYAQKMGVNKQVFFIGKVESDELADYYAASDIFVLPTWKDCLPKVFIEAALFSLPIVTTDMPGSIGVFPENGVSGFSVTAGDVVALTDAVRLLANTNMRKEMSINCNKKVLEFCDAKKETKGFVTAIRTVINVLKLN